MISTPEVEVRSSSGRKIKPKRFADDDELINKSLGESPLKPPVTVSPKVR